MKKKCIYLILFISVLTIFLSFHKKNSSETLKIEGIKYKISVNGKNESNFPEKGPYEVDVSCEGSTGSWNYQEWVAEITEVTNETLCTISFNSVNKTNFNDYIKDLLGSNTSVLSESTSGNASTLEKISDNGEDDYRYRGINPANYILFNDELWRIIGVFDSNTHEISGTHLVKIIRNSSIGSYVFDNDTSQTMSPFGKSSFPESDIYKILNTAYYNHIDASDADYCYSYQTSLKGKCDFTGIGVQTNYQMMVENSVDWFLGGVNPGSLRSAAYNAERNGSATSSKPYVTTSSAGLTVPVGLMYVSDYAYASPETCLAKLQGYGVSTCAAKNWLKSNFSEWTINGYGTTYSSESYISEQGSISYTNAYSSFEVRPTLYLKPDVYYLSGNGTQSNPYIVGFSSNTHTVSIRITTSGGGGGGGGAGGGGAGTGAEVAHGQPYTYSPSGSISSVTVTMGGTDITSSVYSGGSIYIPSVTADVIINIVQNSGGGTGVTPGGGGG